MADNDQSIQAPLLHNEADAQPTHTFTFTNGITRSISQRDVEASCTPEWIWGEMRKQLYIAGPMICVSLLNYSLIVVSVMFVGHLGELELASASMATSFAGVTGTSMLMGMGSALETLCGQAYGAKQYHMLGIYLQRALFVLNLVSLPVAVLWWRMDALLKLLGQDPQISDMAGQYARCLIPALFAVACLQPLVKFLQTQSVVLPMALFSVTTLALHIPLCWLLIYKLGIGFRGAAIASCMSNWLNVLFLICYVKFSPRCKKTWTTFSREAFNDLPNFFKLAIPSTIMICLEYWSFESLVILSGLLPNPKLETATLSICLTTVALLYMIPFGISAAVSTRVSNELGAGRPQAAKAAVTIGVSMGLLEGTLMASLLYSVRNVWGWAFTSEQEVVDYVARCTPLLATLAVMDSIQGVVSGVARGCGWQAFGAVANLGAYYIVGLPIAIVLAFVFHFNGVGLWTGILCGITTQSITLVIMTVATNWQKQAENALGRVYSSASATLPIEANYVQKSEIADLLEKDSDQRDQYSSLQGDC